jgi:cysteine desulfurase family protein (TIGR01976 family)
MPATLPDHARIRRAFPALAGPTVLLDNAGGSQVPQVVADAMREYLLRSYVQLDAPYALSQRSTATVQRAHELVTLLMNGAGAGRVILGPSSTALLNMLAGRLRLRLRPGERVIVAESGHEANAGCWHRLERDGIEVVTWPFDHQRQACTLEGLRPLLGRRSRLVAFPHVSNLLGAVEDAAAITAAAHEAGARVVVDGVAYAPHRAIDVRAWGVDWYVYSTYKVYGPHMAALFGRDDALGELEPPNHFVLAEDGAPYAFEPGGVSHEGCAGLVALWSYLAELARRPAGAAPDRAAVEDAFAVMTECERPLIERLVAWLAGRRGVRIVGPDHAGDERVGTVSFVHASMPARQIAAAVCARDIGIRSGHMYAWRLCRALGLDPPDGVVRVSLVHYNALDEIERLIDALDEILP